MSKSEEHRSAEFVRTSLKELDASVGQILEELARLRGRVKESEKRTRDVEDLLRRFTKGEVDPGSLQERLSLLEGENQDLRTRIEEGRAGVKRILDRIRFLEEHR